MAKRFFCNQEVFFHMHEFLGVQRNLICIYVSPDVWGQNIICKQGLFLTASQSPRLYKNYGFALQTIQWKHLQIVSQMC